MIRMPVRWVAAMLLAVAAFAEASTTPQMAGGDNYVLALSSDGKVLAWGDNFYGQLGDGTAIQRTSPVVVSKLSGVVALARSGVNHRGLAITADGSLWAWGDNSYGGLGDNTTTSRTEPVQVKNLGSVVAAAAGSHSLALKADGTVWAWGGNFTGNLGNGSTDSSKLPVQVPGLTGIAAIAAGGNHSLALRNDGTVWSWGDNSYGQLGNGSTAQGNSPALVSGLSGVVAVAASSYHSLALTSDGAVWTWGRNHYGQLGDGTQANRTLPVKVAGLKGVAALAGGGSFSLALRQDGTVWGWGANSGGQLADGTTASPHLAPTQILGLSDVDAIAACSASGFALKRDGSVWSWGSDSFGQLGGGGLNYRTDVSPVRGQNLEGYLSLGTLPAVIRPSFGATAIGSVDRLTLIVHWVIADTDIGKTGVMYLAARVGSTWYFNSQDSWLPYTGGALPAYVPGPLRNSTIQVLRDANATALKGAQLVFGYGLNEQDMIANGKYAVVYTFP